MSTAGARHLAESKIWLASQQVQPQSSGQPNKPVSCDSPAIRELSRSATAPLRCFISRHMSADKLAAMDQWAVTLRSNLIN